MAVSYFTDRLNVSQYEEAKRMNAESFRAMLDRANSDGSGFADELVLGDEVRELFNSMVPAEAATGGRAGGNVSARYRCLGAPGRPL
jgi:hypothetical protein